ncbi:MAG: hypothetical protein R3D78_10090 [Paracoccaceae bacterium]|jgi:hypothetical protein
MALREDAIARHRARLFEVLKDPEMAAFYEKLTDPGKSARIQRQYLRRAEAPSFQQIGCGQPVT